jgi:hypothetical protein
MLFSGLSSTHKIVLLIVDWVSNIDFAFTIWLTTSATSFSLISRPSDFAFSEAKNLLPLTLLQLSLILLIWYQNF